MVLEQVLELVGNDSFFADELIKGPCEPWIAQRQIPTPAREFMTVWVDTMRGKGNVLSEVRPAPRFGLVFSDNVECVVGVLGEQTKVLFGGIQLRQVVGREGTIKKNMFHVPREFGMAQDMVERERWMTG